MSDTLYENDRTFPGVLKKEQTSEEKKGEGSLCLCFPKTIEEAIRLQTETGGAYLAGGTVTLVNYHRRRPVNNHQISLDKVEELKKICRTEDILSIGSMVTMDELESSEEVKTLAYALWQAAAEVGGPQIRNRATLGGNLAAASPSSECAVPLLAMDAKLLIRGTEGMRRVRLREFFLGRLKSVLLPDELIAAVEIPVNTKSVSAFRKVGKRNALAVSCLNMAVVRTGKKIAVSVGAAAPKPVFCSGTSEILSKNGAYSAEAEEVLQTEICPIDDRWATASYRRTVCSNLLKALLQETEECI